MQKPKCILIEGIDNVGKSTLIRNLKNHYNDEIFLPLNFSNVKQDQEFAHISYSTKLYTNMFDVIQFQTKVLRNSIIIDRSHIGEMVYSPLYRNYSGDYVLDIEKQYDLSNTFLITLVDKAENVIARDDGLSLSTDIDMKNKELELFHKAHEKSKIKYKFLFNIDGHTIEQVKNKVIDFINDKKEYND